MSKHQVERPGHVVEIERVDEQARVPDLPPGAAAEEAPKLVLGGPSLPRGLLLQGAERSELTLTVDDLLHRGGTESADQLVLQVRHAHVETESFQIGASDGGTEAGPLEATPEVALLCSVAETRELDVKPLSGEQMQEASDGLRTPDRHDGNALGVEIPATARSERFERDLVAAPFDEHDRTRSRACGSRMCCSVHARILATRASCRGAISVGRGSGAGRARSRGALRAGA